MRLMRAVPRNVVIGVALPAIDVGGTICAAEKLWKTLDRPDLTSSRLDIGRRRARGASR
jgi:hypothetical protein